MKSSDLKQFINSVIDETEKQLKKMPDITMCGDEECPLKETCYRYTAPANPYYQNYFTTSPRKDDKCDFLYSR